MKKLAAITLKTIVLVCAIVYSTPANAQLDLDFSIDGIVGATFDLLIGTEQTVSVSVTQSGNNDQLSSSGLVGFGVIANSTTTSGATAAITDLAVNPAFNFPSGTNEFDETSLNAGAITLGIPSVSGTSVLLTDFDIQVSDVGTTVFTFDDRTAGLDDFSTGDNEGLDGIIFAGGRTFSLTVNGVDPTAIPEPSSTAILLAITVCGATLRRRS